MILYILVYASSLYRITNELDRMKKIDIQITLQSNHIIYYQFIDTVNRIFVKKNLPISENKTRTTNMR